MAHSVHIWRYLWSVWTHLKKSLLRPNMRAPCVFTREIYAREHKCQVQLVMRGIFLTFPVLFFLRLLILFVVVLLLVVVVVVTDLICLSEFEPTLTPIRRAGYGLISRITNLPFTVQTKRLNLGQCYAGVDVSRKPMFFSNTKWLCLMTLWGKCFSLLCGCVHTFLGVVSSANAPQDGRSKQFYEREINARGNQTHLDKKKHTLPEMVCSISGILLFFSFGTRTWIFSLRARFHELNDRPT